MSQPFIGEIRMFGGSFAPAGWAFCDGQLLPIAENDALFNLIGTTYGGDGQETFALPNLQSRIPIHHGNGFVLAESGGSEEATLTVNQIPQHTHPLTATSNSATSQSPDNGLLATAQAVTYFNLLDNPATMSAQSIAPAGGSQPHANVQPFLCISFIISLFGIFPTQN